MNLSPVIEVKAAIHVKKFAVAKMDAVINCHYRDLFESSDDS